MGRIRKWLRGIPLFVAFVICGLGWLLAAFGLTKATLWFANKNIDRIMSQYQSAEIVKIVPSDDSSFFAIFNIDKDRNNNSENNLPSENASSDELQAIISPNDFSGFRIYSADESSAALSGIEMEEYSGRLPSIAVPSIPNEQIVRYQLQGEDQKKYSFFSGLHGIAAILWYSVCLIVAALAFYLWKIKKPLRALNSAVQKISENDLNFRIHYEGQDEFGRLCQAFEIMRQELAKNNRKMWNSVEERKRLNAAFAHDLRTPLTVIRGYIDLLSDHLKNDMGCSDEAKSFVHEISDQIVRLNNFTDTMGRLQRLEDYEPCRKSVSSSALMEIISETAALIFPNGTVAITSELKEQKLHLDKEALAQICENILSNAARHAKEKITVLMRQDQEYVTILIEDDGNGFTKKDLENAALAYYRGEKTKDNASFHFGLGLYISSLLAKKLGGDIQLGNGESGGAKVSIKIRTI